MTGFCNYGPCNAMLRRRVHWLSTVHVRDCGTVLRRYRYLGQTLCSAQRSRGLP